MGLQFISTSFAQGEIIPREYSYRDGNKSPALQWSEVPPATRTCAVTCLDPDSRYGIFTHWVIFNIPGTADRLPAGVPNLAKLPDGSKQAKNDYGEYGYGGPNPPKDQKHRYVFTLYILDIYLDQLSPAALNKELISFLKEHCIARAEYFGVYQGLGS